MVLGRLVIGILAITLLGACSSAAPPLTIDADVDEASMVDGPVQSRGDGPASGLGRSPTDVAANAETVAMEYFRLEQELRTDPRRAGLMRMLALEAPGSPAEGRALEIGGDLIDSNHYLDVTDSGVEVHRIEIKRSVVRVSICHYEKGVYRDLDTDRESLRTAGSAEWYVVDIDRESGRIWSVPLVAGSCQIDGARAG